MNWHEVTEILNPRDTRLRLRFSWENHKLSTVLRCRVASFRGQWVAAPGLTIFFRQAKFGYSSTAHANSHGVEPISDDHDGADFGKAGCGLRSATFGHCRQSALLRVNARNLLPNPITDTGAQPRPSWANCFHTGPNHPHLPSIQQTIVTSDAVMRLLLRCRADAATEASRNVPAWTVRLKSGVKMRFTIDVITERANPADSGLEVETFPRAYCHGHRRQAYTNIGHA